MKPVYFIIALLAIALTFVTYKWIACSSDDASQAASDGQTETAPASGLVNTIMTRTSVRAYSDREIRAEFVDTLLRAAMAAPTAMNLQPWQFVVITDRATLDSIASNCRNISMASQAQLAIAVCGDLDIADKGEGQPYWIQDCSAATENLLLAAHAMGLGAVWCGIYPIEERVAFVRSLLQLPDNIIPLNIVPIGYPAAATSPKDKYKPERIHENKWNPNVTQ